MLNFENCKTLLLVACASASVYLVCYAESPVETPSAAEAQAIPQELFRAGPIEPLRDMAGEVKVFLRESQKGAQTISGALIGLDSAWVVVRVDHMRGENKYSDFQWIPVSNIQSMTQSKVYPKRLKTIPNQIVK